MFSASPRFVVPPLLMLISAGCMPPMGSGYMGPGYPYQQPMYAPPGNLNAPGTLIVPPASNAPFYDPSRPSGNSTYESNPSDTWQAPGGTGTGSKSGTFESDDAVPKPKDPGTRDPFYNDLNSGAPTTSVDPSTTSDPAETRPASELDGTAPGIVAVRPASGWTSR